MQGKTHAAVGTATYVFMCNKLPGKFDFLAVFVVIFASLLPDIDHPKSMVNKYVLPIKNERTRSVFYVCMGIILLWFDYIYTNKAVLKSIGAMLIAIGLSSHRNGLTHSVVGLMIFSCIIAYAEKEYTMAYLTYYFVIGYGMHLMCDMTTKKGIPFLYPFAKKKMKFPFTYKVGSKKGNVIEITLIFISLAYIGYKLPKLLGIKLW